MKRKIYRGDLIVQAGKSVVLDYEEITGNVYVDGKAKLDAPKLETVGGYVDVYGKAKLDALTTVGGYVYMDGEAKLDALTTVGGYVYVYGEAKIDAPKLETVGSNVYVHGKAKLDALTTVGGYVSVDGEAKIDAPKLETVGSNVDVHVKAKLDAPKLETVGGNVDVHVKAKLDAPNIKEKDTPEARAKAKAALVRALKDKGLVLADGILSYIIHERGDVMITRRIGSNEREYLVRDGEYSAHGATIKEAMADLKYKRSSRDTSQFKAWNRETEVSFEDAILAYRSITGACASGVRAFCEGKDLPERLTISRVIKETQGKYGNKEFENFFN